MKRNNVLEKVNLITLLEIDGKVLWTQMTTSVCGVGKLDVCSWNWLGLNNNSLLEIANFGILKEQAGLGSIISTSKFQKCHLMWSVVWLILQEKNLLLYPLTYFKLCNCSSFFVFIVFYASYTVFYFLVCITFIVFYALYYLRHNLGINSWNSFVWCCLQYTRVLQTI